VEPMNREQRRHPERAERDDGVAPPEQPQSSQHDIAKAGNQDVQSVRAKNSGHGKKTADKWNQ
jgi:hypothetical protein